MELRQVLKLISLVAVFSTIIILVPKHSSLAINRGQESYYLEKKTFTDSVEELRLGIATETETHTHIPHPKVSHRLN